MGSWSLKLPAVLTWSMARFSWELTAAGQQIWGLPFCHQSSCRSAHWDGTLTCCTASNAYLMPGIVSTLVVSLQTMSYAAVSVKQSNHSHCHEHRGGFCSAHSFAICHEWNHTLHLENRLLTEMRSHWLTQVPTQDTPRHFDLHRDARSCQHESSKVRHGSKSQ